MHWRSRSFPSGGTLERRQFAQSVFEKPARLFALMFFAGPMVLLAVTVFLSLFVDLD